MMIAIAAVSLALACPPADEAPEVDPIGMKRALMEEMRESLQTWEPPPGHQIILGPRIAEPLHIDLSDYRILLDDMIVMRPQPGETAQLESPPDQAVWTMIWDDVVDGSVAGRDAGVDAGVDRSCRIDVRIRNGTFAGEYVGPVMGEMRDAYFTGTSFQCASGAVFNFQEDQHGYRCVYAGRLTSEGHIAGTWYDTHGSSGDFVMWHDGNQPQSGVNADSSAR